MADGAISYAHAAALTRATQDLPAATTTAAEPVLLEAARRLDPPRLRKVVGHLCEVADPDAADIRAQRRHDRRGLWVVPTFEGMVAVDGLLDPEAGETLLTALEPLARPSTADDQRSGAQRNADALTELARRALESGQLPQIGGVRPQVTVTIDLASLLGQAGLPGAEGGWVGPLPAETGRRLACDAALLGCWSPATPTTRPGSAATVIRPGRTATHRRPGRPTPCRHDPAAPALGGARSEPLDLGRATRVVSPAQRTALTVRDGGCKFPECDRPLAWCDAHHLRHWLHGGPTDLGNLLLLCRAHHHAVHEGGWRLDRHADGTITASPPHRRRTTAA